MPSRFSIGLGLVAAGAFVLRLLATFPLHHYHLAGDALYFHGQANALAQGLGFVEGVRWLRTGATHASALHPPAYPVVLAGVSLLGGKTVDAQRVASCLIGTGTVVVLGLLGRRLGGDALGLVTAVLAAVVPALWIADTQLLSEGLYGLAISGTLLAAYRFSDRPTIGRLAALTAAACLAGLVRGEALLLLPLLVLPLLVRGARGTHGQLGRQLAAAGGVTLALLAPWVAYNTARFGRVTFANNSGAVIMLTNCDATYEGSLFGYWSHRCLRPDSVRRNEAEENAAALEEGTAYARKHVVRTPVLALARMGRTLDVYRVPQNLDLEDELEGRGRWQATSELIAYYLVAALTIPGVVALRRARVPLFPLVCMAVLTLVAVATTYGNVRFRIPLDVALVVTGAAGIVALGRLVAPGHSLSLPPPPLKAGRE